MTPSPTLEDRLRRTLVAEADRHPVHPDLAAVRASVEDGEDGDVGPGALIDLRAAPRRNRTRLVAAAAVVAVLVAGTVAFVTTRDGGGEPVVADAPAAAPSGWYLPGPDWTIEQVHVLGPTANPGMVRFVSFMPAPGAPDRSFPQMDVTVTRTTDPDDAIALAADREEDVWADAGGIRYREAMAGSVPSVDVVATAPDGSTADVLPTDDLVLRVRSFGMARADVLALAAAWSTSGALPTPDGMARLGDTTSAASPVPPDMAAAPDIRSTVLDGRAVVGVEVRGPDGQEASYQLDQPGHGRPTGTLPAAEARAAGLTDAELSVERPGLLADATVWQAPDDGEGPGFTVETSGASIGARGEGAEALVASLRPATADEWAAAVRDVPSERVRLVLAPTLADVRVVEEDFMDGATGTTYAEPPGEASTTTTTEPPPPTTVASGPAPVDGLLSGAGATALAGEVTVGFLGDTTADVVLAGDDRFDPARWHLPLELRWGRDGTASALDLVASTGIQSARPGPVDPTCAGPSSGATDDNLVVIRPVAVGSCIDWFAIAVRLDAEGRVAEVRFRLWEP